MTHQAVACQLPRPYLTAQTITCTVCVVAGAAEDVAGTWRQGEDVRGAAARRGGGGGGVDALSPAATVAAGVGRHHAHIATLLRLRDEPGRPRAAPTPPRFRAGARLRHRLPRPPAAGIVCSNTDLLSILTSLATSAQEINREPEPAPPPAAASRKAAAPAAAADHKRKRLKDLRSNSFDISMLLGKAAAAAAAKEASSSSPGAVGAAPASWFAKRHQPRKASADSALQPAKSPVLVTFRDDRADASLSPAEPEAEPPPQPQPPPPPPDHKVVWDGKSGSVVDAQVLGSAIEVFLARRGSGGGESPPPGPSPTRASPVAAGKPQPPPVPPRQHEEEASSSDTCDTSICSTLKDLFVKAKLDKNMERFYSISRGQKGVLETALVARRVGASKPTRKRAPNPVSSGLRQNWLHAGATAIRQTLEAGEYKGGYYTMFADWSGPPSPDLNPIEQLWDELDLRVRAHQARPKSIAHLREWLQEEWRQIPVDVLQTLVEWMPDRVAAVIAARAYTKGNAMSTNQRLVLEPGEILVSRVLSRTDGVCYAWLSSGSPKHVVSAGMGILLYSSSSDSDSSVDDDIDACENNFPPTNTICR
ncbi:hypothetical protein PR048_030760 [Dryococelus australis]|uniref:Uncharacterized protein n=1 Tax=Dryococelus australis TaxID=614101 RepID=A0ABQ9G9U2_9NEOP|nr:hypothetical protein PR048_030760 [Dryococelus australis]